jgi:branched-chain amino acid transport system ATP-binding protein
MSAGLIVKDLSVSHGAITAIHELTFEVAPGELVALIGANGAGKTTLLRALSGLLAAEAGGASWSGESLLKKKPEELVRSGIVHVCEGKSVIPELTVQENLAIGGLWRKDKADIRRATKESLDLFPALQSRSNQRADTLSGGERQMLAIARSLISRPKLLLLDEPSLGLAPLIIEQIFESLKQLKADRGLTILLVEQNAMSALKIADRGLILNLGRLVASGTPRELIHDPELRNAYLGF